jgi:hypothetical protein
MSDGGLKMSAVAPRADILVLGTNVVRRTIQQSRVGNTFANPLAERLYVEPDKSPGVDQVTENMGNLSGGGSHRRTCLRPHGIPRSMGRYREFLAVPSGSGCLAADMRLFLLVKLSEFPMCRNRDFLRRNRELGHGNRELAPLQQAMIRRAATRASGRYQV